MARVRRKPLSGIKRINRSAKKIGKSIRLRKKKRLGLSRKGKGSKLRRRIPRRGVSRSTYNKAYDMGFDQAYNEGYNVGHSEGVESGHQEAYKGE